MQYRLTIGIAVQDTEIMCNPMIEAGAGFFFLINFAYGCSWMWGVAIGCSAFCVMKAEKLHKKRQPRCFCLWAELVVTDGAAVDRGIEYS